MQHPEKKTQKPASKRRHVLPALLCVALLLAAALVLLLPQIKERFPAAPVREPTQTSHEQVLAEYTPSQIASVTVRHAAGDAYTIICKDGVPYLQRDGQLLDLNDAVSEQFMTILTRLVAVDEVTADVAEVREHLPDMGLAPARTTVTVARTDGGQAVLEIGLDVPDTGRAYFRWSGAAGVYLCDAGVSELFAMTENRLLPVNQPVLVGSLVDKVTLTNESGAMTLSLAATESGGATGALLTPFVYPLDETMAATALDCLTNLRLGTLEGPLTEDNKAAWGFAAPLCVLDVHQRSGVYAGVSESGQLTTLTAEEQSLRFTFGRAEGDYFYTCLYEGNVYLVSRLLADTLVLGDADKWLTRQPAALGGDLRSLTVTEGERTFAVLSERRERVLPNNQLETDEQGNIVYDTAVTQNGQPMTMEAWEALVSRLNAMTVSGDVPEGWTPGDQPPRWQMTLTDQAGTVRTLTAYRLDAFSDALAVDGVIRHFVYTEALDTALGEWR